MEIKCHLWLDLTMPYLSCEGLACGEVRPTTQQRLIRLASGHDMFVLFTAWVIRVVYSYPLHASRVACNLKCGCLVNKT